jgi:hypothetical protein
MPRIGGGFSGENLKRHICAISHGTDAPEAAPSTLHADSPIPNDPHFKVSEGRLSPIQRYPRISRYVPCAYFLSGNR